MTTTAAPTRTARTARTATPVARHHRRERTPNPVASVIFCLVVMAGGALAIDAWATDTCPTPAGEQLGAVCTVLVD